MLVLSSANVFSYINSNGTIGWSKRLPKTHPSVLIILTERQKHYFNFLKEEEEKKVITILFQSEPAVNLIPGHGTLPRNTVIIFKFNNVESDKNAAMPAMPVAG